MICYLDRSFCFSEGCTNACGRQLTDEHRAKAQEAGLPISGGYFCGNEYEYRDKKEEHDNQ